MIEHLVDKNLGQARVTYKLRDWLFSRQRYWGEPFPLVHNPDGTVRAVPESELPVELPAVPDYHPSEEGEPPLARAEDVAKHARRRQARGQHDAAVGWQLLVLPAVLRPDQRRCSVVGKEAEKYWLPVDLYVGGIEHAATHLLYSRFWHKVLYDLGYVSHSEPFERLVNQGMILGATFLPLDKRRDENGEKVVFLPDDVEVREKDGNEEYFVKDGGEKVEVQWDKMSKSRGNVVNPDEVIAQYGADSIRMYEMFMGPLEQSAPWQTSGLAGRAPLPAADPPAVLRRRRGADAGGAGGRGGDRAAAEAPASHDPRGHRAPRPTGVQHGDRLDDGVRP